MNESHGVFKQHAVLRTCNFYNIIHMINFFNSYRSICKTLNISVVTRQLAIHVEY